MIEDLNKNVTIDQYNYLNLPQQLNMNPDGTDEINYLYTANGQKLMKQTRIENAVEQTVDYIGNFVYEDNVLKFILTGEGRVLVNSGGTYEYQYSLKDHLGNTRITFNQNGQIIQKDAYYPFGMQMNGLCYETGEDYKNKYLYNGKELQDEFGLDWYDYCARFYDAELGRFHIVDPRAESYYSWSPYNYVGGNPLIRVDEYGEFWNYVGGAIIGAIVEAGTQVAVSMAQGQRFSEALGNVDIVDVGLAAVEGAATSGGSAFKTLARKGATIAISEGLKATTDLSVNEGPSTTGGVVGENKSLTETATDFAIGMTGTKASQSIVEGSTKMTSNALKSGTHSTLTNSEKATARAVNNVVNSTGFDQGVNAATNIAENVTNNAATSVLSGSTSTSTISTTYTMARDNTNIVRPIIKLDLPN